MGNQTKCIVPKKKKKREREEKQEPPVGKINK